MTKTLIFYVKPFNHTACRQCEYMGACAPIYTRFGRHYREITVDENDDIFGVWIACKPTCLFTPANGIGIVNHIQTNPTTDNIPRGNLLSHAG